jgi:hypothetical protein
MLQKQHFSAIIDFKVRFTLTLAVKQLLAVYPPVAGHQPQLLAACCTLLESATATTQACEGKSPNLVITCILYWLPGSCPACRCKQEKKELVVHHGQAQTFESSPHSRAPFHLDTDLPAAPIGFPMQCEFHRF